MLGGVVNAQRVGCWWADGYDARAKFYTYSHIVVGREAAFAEADCKLGELERRNVEVECESIH